MWVRNSPRRVRSLTLLLAVGAGLAGCTRPGEGPEAARAFAVVTPVLDALDAYHALHDAYPAALDDLTPALLSPVALTAATARPTPALRYGLVEEGFALSFLHGGRFGKCRCELESDTDGWACVWQPL